MNELPTLESILMTLLGGAGVGGAGLFGFKKLKASRVNGGSNDAAIIATIHALETALARIDTRVDDLGDAVERQNNGIVSRTERILAKQDSMEAKVSHLEGFLEAKLR